MTASFSVPHPPSQRYASQARRVSTLPAGELQQGCSSHWETLAPCNPQSASRECRHSGEAPNWLLIASREARGKRIDRKGKKLMQPHFLRAFAATQRDDPAGYLLTARWKREETAWENYIVHAPPLAVVGALRQAAKDDDDLRSSGIRRKLQH